MCNQEGIVHHQRKMSQKQNRKFQIERKMKEDCLVFLFLVTFLWTNLFKRAGHYIEPFTPQEWLIDCALWTAGNFYSSKGDPLGVKGLRLVFNSDRVIVWVKIRSVEWNNLVKFKPTESEAEHQNTNSAYDSDLLLMIQWKLDCQSRKQKQKNKPITPLYWTLWFVHGSSASAYDILVFPGS